MEPRDGTEYCAHGDASRRILRRGARQDTGPNSTKTFESRTTLGRQIARFREIQAVYMPVVPRLLSAASQAVEDKHATLQYMLAENVALWMPSDMLKTEHDSLEGEDNATTPVPDGSGAAFDDDRVGRRQVLLSGFAPGLVDAELRLRRAQCHSAIEDLRTKLHMRTRFYGYKKLNVRHQGPNTKANEALSNIGRRIQRAANKYRAARDALKSLVGTHADWVAEYHSQFPALKDSDIHALGADDPDTARRKKKMRKGKKIAQGSVKVSWIWRGADGDGDDGLSAGTYGLHACIYTTD